MILEELIAMAEHEIAMIIKVLPEEIREHAQNCPISFEDVPRDYEGLDEETLGVFEGASLAEEPSPEAMPQIRIFVGNVWEFAGEDEQDFLDEIGTTFLHELGHYLGWDEEQIVERGLE